MRMMKCGWGWLNGGWRTGRTTCVIGIHVVIQVRYGNLGGLEETGRGARSLLRPGGSVIREGDAILS